MTGNTVADVLCDAGRLDALLRSRALHQRNMRGFDRIVEMACLILKVPTCCISLIDAKRQIYKSQRGLPTDVAAEGNIPIEDSICQYVVARGEGVIIANTGQHLLTHYNSMLQERRVMAYIGMPLMSEGYVIGTICALDNKPREWTEEEAEILEHLAHFCMLEIKRDRLADVPLAKERH